MRSEDLAGGILRIDLDALVQNYEILNSQAPKAECAAVVKANAYGLGADRIGPALWNKGCRTFFVALPEEGIKLRHKLPQAQIFILNGLLGSADTYTENSLIPVIGDLQSLKKWNGFAKSKGLKLPALLHIDTGISRLGFVASDLEALHDVTYWDHIEILYVMSHLACADEAQNPMNYIQRNKLQELRSQLPENLQNLPISFANSSGIFLGQDYHFDLLRPGVALYGANPTPDKDNPMSDVIELKGKILQVDTLDKGTTVGYGSTYITQGKERIAKIAIGYADGYPRNLGGIAEVGIDGARAPIVGRISMDMLTVNMTAIPEEKSRAGEYVTLIGDGITLEEVAEKSGTIPYEILTSLGHRYYRDYVGGE
ncbi:alanine racemase [Sneathiella sp. P13V-1]|uniref:alanine racemase n=1 Tax=Sneathiella sp. P13V-1 TaxID=2697366 RepID=UPI00187BBBF9|nr:alanine racemase [Sneathiella sp. P13V-1]MBE7636996.1 alanine racemase [Sneathiella sp. P13V-1]